MTRVAIVQRLLHHRSTMAKKKSKGNPAEAPALNPLVAQEPNRPPNPALANAPRCPLCGRAHEFGVTTCNTTG